MKRIFFIIAALGLVTAVHAQCGSDSTGSKRQVTLTLGVQAGATLFTTGNTPYDSPYGLKLQIPLVTTIPLSDSWQLVTGLRYDFEWAPLRYNVEPAAGGGLDFVTTPATGRQTAIMHQSYLGIPFEVEWYPFRNNHRLLHLSLDIYGGYAVSRYLKITTRDARNTYFGTQTSRSSEVVESSDPMFQPWKLEVGFTVGTDMLGLIHGVRFFTNLLPTYRDPASGQKIYTSGMTFYL